MSEWISVKDRLPDTSERGAYGNWFLVFGQMADGKPRCDVGIALKGTFMGHALQFGNITHWMPLPDPPSAEKEGERG